MYHQLAGNKVHTNRKSSVDIGIQLQKELEVPPLSDWYSQDSQGSLPINYTAPKITYLRAVLISMIFCEKEIL